MLYIGAGAVAAGGIISLLRALPLIVGSIWRRAARRAATRGAAGRGGRQRAAAPIATCPLRCRRRSASLGLVLAIWLTLPLGTLFSWVQPGGRAADRALRLPLRDGFVAVDGRDRLVVEPDLGHDRGHAAVDLPDLPGPGLDRPPAPSDGAVGGGRSSASPPSNGGTTSQDLKTGYLVGATPKYQQWAILVGSISSALVIGWILVVLNQAEHGLHRQGPAAARSSRSMSARLTERGTGPRRRHARITCGSGTEGNRRARPAGQVSGRRPRARSAIWSIRASTGVVSHRDDGTEVPQVQRPQGPTDGADYPRHPHAESSPGRWCCWACPSPWCWN